MKPIRVGVIGAGRMGRIRVENLCKMPNVELVYLATPNLEEVLPWAQSWGIQNVILDAQQIFADQSVGAVVICSPTDSHAEYILAAARHGKHIFCEKPIANDVMTTRQVLDEVLAAGVLFQVGFNRRFDSNFVKIRTLCEKDQIGDIHIVNITSRDPMRPDIEFVKRSGGMYVDMMIHDFDMIRFLTASEIEEVYATGAVMIDEAIGVVGDVDTAIVVVKMTNGAIATIDNSRETHYGYDQRVEVFGSKGSAVAHHKRGHKVVISTGDGVEKDKPLYFLVERYMDSFAHEIKGFIESIRLGKEPLVNGEDAFQALLGSLAAQRSYLENRPVLLSEIR